MLNYLRRVLETNISQREEEGVEVAEFRERLARCDAPDAALLVDLIEKLEAAPVSACLAHAEPGDFDAIIAACPDYPQPSQGPSISADQLLDRTLGGWLGRAAGCRLGRPLEAAPMGHLRQDIRRYLQSIGRWPLDRYLPDESGANALDPAAPQPFAGMARDDDLDYPILNLLLIEQNGPDWTHENARELWLRHLSHDLIYAAGRAAYEALCIGILPPRTATWGNPCRQSLGGMIRCDTWGWVCPGDPARAAELAYRDAVISQTANGVYSAMFFAAVIAEAFRTNAPRAAIQQGLRCGPPHSRFGQAIRLVIDTWDREPDWNRGLDVVYEHYSRQYFNAAIINACIVVLAMLEGQGSLGRTISAAVCGGFDTDCNGATAGSICGVMLGASALPVAWIDPLNDRYETFLAGLGVQRFSNLAERTVAVALREQGI